MLRREYFAQSQAIGLREFHVGRHRCRCVPDIARPAACKDIRYEETLVCRDIQRHRIYRDEPLQEGADLAPHCHPTRTLRLAEALLVDSLMVHRYD
jgi:hypothetical protein